MDQPLLPRHAVLNGHLQPSEAVRVSPFGDGFMFGHGVFETLRVSEGRPEFWTEHWQRLQSSARELGLDYRQTSDNLLARCNELTKAEGVAGAVLKIVVFRDGEAASELISLREIPYSEQHYDRGFSLKVVSGRGSSLSLGRFKTQNYLANLLALRSARAEGFDEVVFVDEQGQLLEGATTNIFLVRGDAIFTPPVSAGILPGVIRGRLLRDPSARVEERPLALEDLRVADAVFVTNSVLRVMPVCRVGDCAVCGTRAAADRARRTLVT